MPRRTKEMPLREKEPHTVVQSFCTPAPVMVCLDGKSEYAGREQGQVHDKTSPFPPSGVV